MLRYLQDPQNQTQINPDPTQSDQSSSSSQCELLGKLGFFIQSILFVCAFAVLIFKRHKERPKRAWRIWSLDVSKQGFSASLMHVLNILLAVIIASENANTDECVWYLVTITLDTTVGVVICWVLLKLLEKYYFERKNLHHYKSGNYIVCIVFDSQEHNTTHQDNDIYVEQNCPSMKPNQKIVVEETNSSMHNIQIGSFIKIDYCVWAVQCVIWCVIVIISKIILFGFTMSLKTGLQDIGTYVLQCFDSAPSLKLIIVLMVVPIILNGIYFWVQDNFLKKNKLTTKEQKLGINKQLYVDVASQSQASSSSSHQIQSLNFANFQNDPQEMSQPYELELGNQLLNSSNKQKNK